MELKILKQLNYKLKDRRICLAKLNDGNYVILGKSLKIDISSGKKEIYKSSIKLSTEALEAVIGMYCKMNKL